MSHGIELGRNIRSWSHRDNGVFRIFRTIAARFGEKSWHGIAVLRSWILAFRVQARGVGGVIPLIWWVLASRRQHAAQIH
jgi:hypothetical protein